MCLETEQANSDKKKTEWISNRTINKVHLLTNDSSTGMWEYVLHIWGGEVEQMNNRIIYRQARFR